MKLIEQYRKRLLVKQKGKPDLKLFGYIRSVFDGGLEDTDEDDSQSLEMQRLDDEFDETTGANVDYKNDFEAEMGSEELIEDDETDADKETTADKTAIRQNSIDYKANTP